MANFRKPTIEILTIEEFERRFGKIAEMEYKPFMLLIESGERVVLRQVQVLWPYWKICRLHQRIAWLCRWVDMAHSLATLGSGCILDAVSGERLKLASDRRKIKACLKALRQDGLKVQWS